MSKGKRLEDMSDDQLLLLISVKNPELAYDMKRLIESFPRPSTKSARKPNTSAKKKKN